MKKLKDVYSDGLGIVTINTFLNIVRDLKESYTVNVSFTQAAQNVKVAII